MLKKISLSVMIFTYLFAGTAHFTHFKYFLSIVPGFIPRPEALVSMTGALQIFLAFFLALSRTRRWACYGILFLWSISLPVNVYVLVIGGAGISLSQWQLEGMIPFHLVLMAWAYWHCLPEKTVGSRRSSVGS